MDDMHNLWPHRWLTNDAKSVESKIDKLGVIATQNIKGGETVAVLGGVIVPKQEINKYWKIMGHVGIQIDDDFFIAPTSRDELEDVGVFNHSCQPNCGFSNSITLVAMRNIEKGEELTFDYAFCESTIKEFKCNCTSKSCREFIKPTDWKMPEIQNKFGKYFSPYLKLKFRE